MRVPWVFRRCIVRVSLLIACLFGTPAIAADTPVQLAHQRFPLMKVVHSATATTRTKKSAQSLADYLSRNAVAKFEVITVDGQSGLVVGTVADIPLLRGE
jgi:hypothetical protein